MNEARSPWREPMVWLVFGIPAATVIAGLATFAIALRAGSVDSVPAPVARVAQAQVLTGTADAAATRGDYRATLNLQRDGATWRIRVETVPAALADAPLQVLFVHPTLARRDVRVELDGRAAARTPAPDFIPQQVIVSDAAGAWRLVGAYSELSAMKLTPALSAQ